LSTCSSSFLACMSTWILSLKNHSGGYLKTRSMPVQSMLGRNCGIKFNNLQVI
jgi:hypothetical protein